MVLDVMGGKILLFIVLATLLFGQTVNQSIVLDVSAGKQSANGWVLPFVPSQVAVYRNGIRLKNNIDYYVVKTTVMIFPAPNSDDIMTFDAIR